jgi:uncharacterized protein (DUF2132 family)
MSQDPLHGITLEQILTELHAKFGWPELADRIRINCFYENPCVKSSLKFLRKTPWARKKVEDLYIYTIARKANKTKKTAQIDTASNQNIPNQTTETDPNSTTE